MTPGNSLVTALALLLVLALLLTPIAVVVYTAFHQPVFL